MAKIWYSVLGEGYGHATRSAPIIRELKKKHKILVTGFDKSYVYLKKKFPKITHKIEGNNFVHTDNEIDIPKTVLAFIKNFPSKFKKNTVHISNLIKRFNPDLIISDFEPASHYFSSVLGIPVINIDNMNVLARCKIKVKKEDFLDYMAALSVIKLFNPSADYHIILTLKNYRTKGKNVFLHRPILREEILETKPTKKDFVLVYQTSKTNIKPIKELKKIKENFIFYGMNETKKDKNIQFRKFSKKGFIEDLASCKAVIMTGGFTTISEAIYLKKPMLIVPSENQYEQKFNGLTLEEMKIGKCELSINKKKVEDFLSNLNLYNKNLEKIEKWDNQEVINKLEKLIRKVKAKKTPIFEFAKKLIERFRRHKYERTLTIIKPDAIKKGLIGEVIKRLEAKKIRPVAMKMAKLNKNKARLFYKHLKNKVPEKVFNSLVKYMSSRRVVIIVWQGRGVVKKVRKICGPTNPKKAKKYQIRALSGEDMEKKFKLGKAVKNIIHSSGTNEEAKKEISFFFMPWEIHKPVK